MVLHTHREFQDDRWRNRAHWTSACHRCGGYVLFPLGSIVVIKNVQSGDQAFLEGHSEDVSCLAVSHDGTKMASGQKNKTNTRADVLIWDLGVSGDQ